MLRTIIFYFQFAISLLLKYPPLAKIEKLKQGNDNSEEFNMKIFITSHEGASDWGRKLLKNAGSTVNVIGQENIPENEPVLFISNHQSNFDIPILLGFINKPKGFIAKVELEKIPILRGWMRNINCIFMDRSDMRNSAESIVKGIKYLKSGYSMVVFPEGTRAKSQNMNEFKAGSFKLATKSKVKIVPITIDGSHRLLESNNNKLTKCNVNVYIHHPIETLNLDKTEELLLPDKVKSIILSKLSKF